MNPTYATVKESVDPLSFAKQCFETGEYDPALAVIGDLVAEGREVFPALLLKACIESERGQYSQCLKTLKQAGEFIDTADPRRRARYYGQRAYANKKLGNMDSPLVDYEAARYWAQRAGDELCEASVRNNLAKRYSELGRLDEAIRESDAAIRIAQDSDDCFLLGRFTDLRAQILLENDLLDDAVKVGKRAVEILGPIGNEVALDEARSTYAHSLIALALSFAELSEPLKTFKLRKQLSARLAPEIDEAALEVLIRQAMGRAGGHVSKAAQLLGVSHPAMIKSVQKFGLTRQPKRRRAKSLPSLKK